MNGLKLFWEFVKNATAEILKNKKHYLSAFFALILFANSESLFSLMGVVPESNLSITLTILTTIATFIVVSQVVLIQKKIHGGVGELKYFVPTFLLYNLYYSFLFFIGLLFIVLPGFYFLIFYSMVPFVAVLDDDCQGSFFKESKLLAKKNIGLMIWASFINLFVELSGLIITPIQDKTIKGVANFFFSVPDAFITLVLTVTFVKIYYYLKKL